MPHTKQHMVIHFNPNVIGVLIYGNVLQLQGFSAAAVLIVLVFFFFLVQVYCINGVKIQTFKAKP